MPRVFFSTTVWPRNMGVEFYSKAWGTLVGQWLLRSMDKAEDVYESMLLRGFTGDFRVRKKKVRAIDVLYPVIWIIAFVFIRHSGIFG